MCDCVPPSERPGAVPASWINEAGRVVHPDAPTGLGGSGAFRSATVLGSDSTGDMLPDPQSPSARTLAPGAVQLAGEAEAAKVVRKPAPTIDTDAADEVVHQIITLKLKADEHGVAKITSAETICAETNNGAQVEIHSNDAGIVDGVTNQLAWTVEIVTQYGKGDPEADAAYGRGTTPADKAAGTVTLGFHESCHRADLLGYFRSTPPPKLDIDFQNKKVTTAQAEAARSAYLTAWKAYFAKARSHSKASTDEAPLSDPPLSKYKPPTPTATP